MLNVGSQETKDNDQELQRETERKGRLTRHRRQVRVGRPDQRRDRSLS